MLKMPDRPLVIQKVEAYDHDAMTKYTELRRHGMRQ